MTSVYALLSEFPSASAIASAHLTRLTHFLEEASKGRYNKDTAVAFREAARASLGSYMPAKSLKLKSNPLWKKSILQSLQFLVSVIAWER